MDLQIAQPEPSTLIITLHGRFDAFSAGSVKESWQHNENIRCVIVDLSRTTFLDSIALSVMVQGLKTMRARNGNFIIANPEEAASTIFELTTMDQAFTIVPSVEDALKLIRVHG